MSRLTRSEIDTLIDDLIVAHPIYTPQLRALREQSLSQEAVREAAEELADLMDDVVEGIYTPDHFTTQPIRRALKREPNAAAESYEAVHPKALDEPALAAPVAEILDDWRIVAEFFQSRNWPDTKLGDAASRLQSRLPALLAKLGQGWVPVGKRDTPLWPSCPKFIECTRADGQVFRLNIPSLPTQARSLR